MLDAVLLWSEDYTLQIEGDLVVVLEEQLSDMLVVRQKDKALGVEIALTTTDPIVIDISFRNICVLIEPIDIFLDFSPQVRYRVYLIDLDIDN